MNKEQKIHYKIILDSSNLNVYLYLSYLYSLRINCKINEVNY